MKKAYNKPTVIGIENLQTNQAIAACDLNIAIAEKSWANEANGGGMSQNQYPTWAECYDDWEDAYYNPSVGDDRRSELLASICRVYRFTNFEGYYMVYEDFYEYQNEASTNNEVLNTSIQFGPLYNDNW